LLATVGPFDAVSFNTKANAALARVACQTFDHVAPKDRVHQLAMTCSRHIVPFYLDRPTRASNTRYPQSTSPFAIWMHRS
jgi:hypothetical protein